MVGEMIDKDIIAGSDGEVLVGERMQFEQLG